MGHGALPAFRDDEDIKAEIRRRGLNLAKLGRLYNVPHSTLKSSFLGPCPKGDRVIAHALGLPVHEVWPDRYDEVGNRKTNHSRNSKPSATGSQRLNGGAR
jgi:Ner family transcriptional regulator